MSSPSGAAAAASVSVTVDDLQVRGRTAAASAAQFATHARRRDDQERAAAGGSRARRAWQISASDCSVLPSPMSSARMPPRPCSQRNASQLEPVAAGRGAAAPQTGAGTRRRLDLVDVQQAPDLPLPGRRPGWLTTPSAASSSHRPAWKRLIRSGAVRLVLQRAGLLDQLAQRLQLAACRSEK